MLCEEAWFFFGEFASKALARVLAESLSRLESLKQPAPFNGPRTRDLRTSARAPRRQHDRSVRAAQEADHRGPTIGTRARARLEIPLGLGRCCAHARPRTTRADVRIPPRGCQQVQVACRFHETRPCCLVFEQCGGLACKRPRLIQHAANLEEPRGVGGGGGRRRTSRSPPDGAALVVADWRRVVVLKAEPHQLQATADLEGTESADALDISCDSGDKNETEDCAPGKQMRAHRAVCT